MSLPLLAARPLVRRSALQIGRRLESTATGKAADAASKATSTAKEATSKATTTAKDAAAKATATASEYAGKAQEGLSRVTSSAGPAIVNAAKGVSGALSKVGGRTGRLVAFVERQVPLVLYYSRVGLELGKIVFRGQNMTPPPVSTFQTYFQNLWKQLQNPSALFRQAQSTTAQAAEKAASQGPSLLQQARNINRAQLVAGGVVVAEVLGFFTVGEMIGRMKLVGYHGETGAHH
ncbi:hypothetical protein BR93DRAFT_969530 [Coniochaeta sp. PMI_546]|nr:hypothetical protein BR93DRAFT_969530 [Coniochaeta sp. PMI_546]